MVAFLPAAQLQEEIGGWSWGDIDCSLFNEPGYE